MAKITISLSEEEMKEMKHIAVDLDIGVSKLISLTSTKRLDTIINLILGENGHLQYDTARSEWIIQNNPLFGQDLPGDISPLMLIIKTYKKLVK